MVFLKTLIYLIILSNTEKQSATSSELQMKNSNTRKENGLRNNNNKNQNQNTTYFSMQGNPQEATKTALQHRKHMYTPLLSPYN